MRDPWTKRLYDSVIANPGEANCGTQVHREYMFYDGAQAYPECLVTAALGMYTRGVGISKKKRGHFGFPKKSSRSYFHCSLSP